MKKITADSKEYDHKVCDLDYERSEKNDAYHAFWECCRGIAECVAVSDSFKCGVRLSEIDKLVENDKRAYDLVTTASEKLKYYKACRKRAIALAKRFHEVP